MNQQSTFWARKRGLARLVVLVACLGGGFWFIRHSQPGPVVKGVKISAIASHSAVLKPDGTLWAWMDNTLFFDSTPSLGIGLPGQIAKGSNWRAIATGWQAFAEIGRASCRKEWRVG